MAFQFIFDATFRDSHGINAAFAQSRRSNFGESNCFLVKRHLTR